MILSNFALSFALSCTVLISFIIIRILLASPVSSVQEAFSEGERGEAEGRRDAIAAAAPAATEGRG